MKRRYHAAGVTDRGDPVYEDCQTGEMRAGRLVRSGQPLIPGARLSTIEPDEDGEHVLLEDIELGSGPAQVATDAYRRGWERAFGPGQAN